MDYGSPSKPTDHKLPKRLFYPNTRYSTSTARPSRPPTPHTKKHATNVDTGILYTTNHPQLTNRKTGNGTTYSGTTLHSAKTSAPLSDTDKHFPKDHKLRKNFNRNTIKISFSSMNNTKQIIYNHNKRILCPSEHIDSTADDTAINIKHATADKITHAHSTETASNHQFSTKPPSHVKTIALVKRTSDLQKTTSRQDTETTLHHSDMQNTETLPNSAKISGLLKTITLATLFHSASFYQVHPKIAQVKDTTSALRKKY